jgi:MGT family glycosyltransferase
LTGDRGCCGVARRASCSRRLAAPAKSIRYFRNTPLVYITFGTIASGMAEGNAVFRTALHAIAELPVRALFTTGHGVDPGALGAIPANVQVEAFVPRDVLPHAAAVVCHGGSGTVMGRVAAGVPMVVVPFGADQPHNAQRIAAMGAGLAVPDATAVTLRTAIERVLAEAADSARRLAEEIASLPSLEQAVAALVGVASRRAQ